MANNCMFDMNIKGDKAAIDEFVGMMRSGGLGRVFSADVDPLSDPDDVDISGDCAWSLISAFRLDETGPGGRPQESRFLAEAKRLHLDIEAYSDEIGMGFEEHLVVKNGSIAIYEEASLDTYQVDMLSEDRVREIAADYKVSPDAIAASSDGENIKIGGFNRNFDGIPALARVDGVLRERFLRYVENEIQESETGMFFVEDDAWLEDDGFTPAEVRAMAFDLAVDPRTKLTMELGDDPFITFYPDFLKYCMDELDSNSLPGLPSNRKPVNNLSISECKASKLNLAIHEAEEKGVADAFRSAMETSDAAFTARIRETGTDMPDRYGLVMLELGTSFSRFLEQNADIEAGTDTYLLGTEDGRTGSIVVECHGRQDPSGMEKVTEVEFRQLRPFEALKLELADRAEDLMLRDDSELEQMAYRAFNSSAGLQMCTELAGRIERECGSERVELAEALWNGDPERGIESLAELGFDDENRIEHEWMGYPAGTPISQVWKDFDESFGKDGVRLNELSGFEDRRIEAERPGQALSDSEFDKLFGSLEHSDMRAVESDSRVRRDAGPRDDPGSGDGR